MERKGVMGLPPVLIAGIFGFLVIGAFLISGTKSTGDFVKAKTIDIQLNRIKSDARILNSVPEGHIEFELEGYEVKLRNRNLSLNKSGKVRSVKLDPLSKNEFSSYKGPDTFEKIDRRICMERTFSGGDYLLKIRPGGC